MHSSHLQNCRYNDYIPKFMLSFLILDLKMMSDSLRFCFFLVISAKEGNRDKIDYGYNLVR